MSKPMPMTTKPCPRCLVLAQEGEIRPETILPVPQGAFAPEARDGSGKTCFDCASAEALQGMGVHPDFTACRVVVGNDRQENLRLPAGIREKYGLVGKGLVRSCRGDNALALHHAWLNQYVPWWFDQEGYQGELR